MTSGYRNDAIALTPDKDLWSRRLGWSRKVDRTIDLVMAALERELVGRKHAGDDLNGFLQTAYPGSGRAERDPCGNVFGLEPARSDAKVQTSKAQQIDSGSRFRNQRRVTQVVAQDKTAQSDPAGSHRQGGQRGHAFDSTLWLVGSTVLSKIEE